MTGKKDDSLKSLRKTLLRERRHAADVLDDARRAEAYRFADDYIAYASAAKTERESTRWFADLLARSAFADASDAATASRSVVVVYRNRVIAAARLGTAPLEAGLTIVAAHHDSPRLDLKTNPIYEDLQFAMLKTHYFGGVRKHQWVARPLAIHGVVALADGRRVDLSIGEDPADPVFTIADLLPHLAANAQSQKKLAEAIPAEKLNVIIGGMPIGGPEEKDRFLLGALRLLHERFGIREEDLVSADIEIVPAGPARYVGLDRAFIGAYGHDDRCCSYAAVRALVDAKDAARTRVAICFDKEEVGSFGDTGAQGYFLKFLVARLMECAGAKPEALAVERALHNSFVISADVGASMDPDWKDVHDKRNAAFAGHGITIKKATGQRGKTAASEASAETVARLRAVLTAAGVPWQNSSMGKVDEGGGGTIAKFMAIHGAEVIDAGPPVLGMHSPFELLHVFDLYSAYAAYRAVFESV